MPGIKLVLRIDHEFFQAITWPEKVSARKLGRTIKDWMIDHPGATIDVYPSRDGYVPLFQIGGENLFEALVGQTITKIEGLVDGSEEVTFHLQGGRVAMLWHQQRCCEYVRLCDLQGSPEDLIDVPILSAVKESNQGSTDDEDDASHTWTFYRLTTIRGTVVMRWLGESNGYYSESVSFEIKAKE